MISTAFPSSRVFSSFMELKEVKIRIPTGKTSISKGFEEETKDRFERHELLIYSVLLIMVITAISTLIDLFSYRLQTQALISDRYREVNDLIIKNEGGEKNTEHAQSSVDSKLKGLYDSITLFDN